MSEEQPHSALAALLKVQIKAVVFDAVGTVIYAMPSVATVYCDTLEKLSGQTVDVDP